MAMSPKTIFKYFEELINTDRVQALLYSDEVDEFPPKRKRGFKFAPSIGVVTSSGYNAGGMSYGLHYCEISSWALSDGEVARGILRHELAHCIHDYLGWGGNPHGKEFNYILKVVSPKKAKKDKHFALTPNIIKAWKMVHPKKGQTKNVWANRTGRYTYGVGYSERGKLGMNK